MRVQYSNPRPILTKEPFKKSWRPKAHATRSGPARFGGKPARGGDRGHKPAGGGDGPLRLFGLHAVEAALRNPGRKLNRLLLTDNAERRLIESMGPLPCKAEETTPRDLDRLLGADTVHQGAMLETEELPEPEFA